MVYLIQSGAGSGSPSYNVPRSDQCFYTIHSVYRIQIHSEVPVEVISVFHSESASLSPFHHFQTVQKSDSCKLVQPFLQILAFPSGSLYEYQFSFLPVKHLKSFYHLSVIKKFSKQLGKAPLHQRNIMRTFYKIICKYLKCFCRLGLRSI